MHKGENSIQTYQTKANIEINVTNEYYSFAEGIETIIDRLDEQRGALFASGFEYPERYTRWDIGFVNPPIAITAKRYEFEINALNQRGKILLPAFKNIVAKLAAIEHFEIQDQSIKGSIKPSENYFPEEMRSKQNSIFSLIREIIHTFASDQDEHLGLYGSFGFDLAHQFESLKLCLKRDAKQRDLVLYLPDEIYIVDHQSNTALIKRYDFQINGNTTQELKREGSEIPYVPTETVTKSCDHEPGEYAKIVTKAKEYFKRGDLFEVVPGRTFYEPGLASPSEIFRRLRERNPAPYASLINLGENEYLVGASPEMFVRVTGNRVETCPISGTIARGEDAIADAKQILELLNSEKDASELTMCTDVDRNDKSRICVPGSVKVIGRRQIEMYSRVIHTVDHVEGKLREGFDALDAFLSHTWVVTVTGAPKIWAMQFIEDHEKSPRVWYGGAIGWLQFNGDINTGLTLRTIRVNQGVAELRVGATLLYDSDPEAEEQETSLKAAAFIDAIRNAHPKKKASHLDAVEKIGTGKNILLVDHQDSFVHTLANYFRQTGAEVTTVRSDYVSDVFADINPDLVVLSPGPGCPKDFDVNTTIELAMAHNKPIFGVCLGLQGIVEYFSGKLDILEYPEHGKPAEISVTAENKLFKGFPEKFAAGRYHSLYADKASLPNELVATAVSQDNIIMAVEHKQLPIAAVQFHPESILSLHDQAGLRILCNVMREYL